MKLNILGLIRTRNLTNVVGFRVLGVAKNSRVIGFDTVAPFKELTYMNPLLAREVTNTFTHLHMYSANNYDLLSMVVYALFIKWVQTNNP